MPKQKTISLPDEIHDDITRRTQSYKMDFSAWVAKCWIDQFMGRSAKEKEIRALKEQIRRLSSEITQIDSRQDTYRVNFLREEIRFLKKVPGLIKEGKEWHAVCNRFNNDFKRDLSPQEFESEVRRIEGGK